MTFRLHTARSVDDAIALARQYGADGKFLAGGTDLIIQITRGRRRPRHVIDISRLPLSGIAFDRDDCQIGGLTTLKTIQNHPDINVRLPALAESARNVGGHQVRNIATIAGNVVNASPAADVVTALLALDAVVHLTGGASQHTSPIDSFLLGPGSTICREDELVTGIRIPLPDRLGSCFLKAGRRKAMEISLVCVATGIVIDPITGNCLHARIALGAVGPRAMRSLTAEAHLLGHRLTAERVLQAGMLAAEECRPKSDVRASAEYRRMLVSALVPKAIRQSTGQIQGT